MHLTVDNAGQDMKAFAIQGLGRGEFADVTYPHNAAFQNGQIARADAIMIDEGSTLQNEVSHAFHRGSLIVAQSDRKWC